MPTEQTVEVRKLWEQYKKETGIVIGFVVSTAQRLQLPGPKRQDHGLTIDVLLRYTREIRQSIEKTEIPDAIIVLAENVRSGRERVHQIFRRIQGQACDSGMEESNRRHGYFLKRWKTLVDELRGAQNHSRSNKKRKLVPYSDENVYEYLELEECRADSTRVKRTKHSGSATVSQTVDLELESDGNIQLVFECVTFLEELSALRSQVSASWDSYINGDIALTAVCTITNHAFRIAAMLEKEFLEARPTLYDMDAIYGLLLMETGASELPQLSTSLQGRSTDDLFMMEAQRALLAFRDVQMLLTRKSNPNAEFPMWSEHCTGWPTHPYSAQLLSIAHEVHLLVPYELDQELAREARLRESSVFWLADPLLQSLLTIAVNGRFLHGATFQTQACMDIYDRTRGDTGLGWRTSVVLVQAIYRSHFLESTLGDKAQGRFIDLEASSDFGPAWSCRSERDDTNVTIPATLLKVLPLTPLKLANDLHEGAYRHGIDMYEKDDRLFSVLNVYRAVRTIGLDMEWPDAEYLLRHQDMPGFSLQEKKDKPLVCDADDIVVSAKRVSLALGVKGKNLRRRNAQPPQLPKRRSSIPKWDVLDPIIRAYLTERLAEGKVSHASNMIWYHRALAPFMDSRSTTVKDRTTIHHFRAYKKLTGRQMLSAMSDIVSESECVRLFDHSAMAERTARLCKRIFATCDTRADVPFAEKTHDFIWRAAITQHPPSSERSPEIAVAISILVDYIREHGSRFYDEMSSLAEKMSSPPSPPSESVVYRSALTQRETNAFLTSYHGRWFEIRTRFVVQTTTQTVRGLRGTQLDGTELERVLLAKLNTDWPIAAYQTPFESVTAQLNTTGEASASADRSGEPCSSNSQSRLLIWSSWSGEELERHYFHRREVGELLQAFGALDSSWDGENVRVTASSQGALRNFAELPSDMELLEGDEQCDTVHQTIPESK